MKKLALGSLVTGFATLTATMSSAAVCGTGPGDICDVPEISALEGTAALAALAAIVLLAWERRRRAA